MNFKLQHIRDLIAFLCLFSLVVNTQAQDSDKSSAYAEGPTVHNNEDHNTTAGSGDASNPVKNKEGKDPTAHGTMADTANQNSMPDMGSNDPIQKAIAIKKLGKGQTPSKYHTITADELLQKYDGLNTRKPWEIIMRQATLAAHSKDTELAEGLFAQALLLSPPVDAQKNAFLEMAKMYEESRQPAKMVSMYEKFTMRFDDDKRLPQIYMRLGSIYRDMGAYNMAISRFYNVINTSLNLDVNEYEAYKDISLQAQLDIAETYFIMSEFEQAEKFFKRLMLLELSPEAQMNVMFKTHYLSFIQEDYTEAISGLEDFLEIYPASDLAPESHYMISYGYNKLDKPREAIKQVLKILNDSQHVTNTNEHIWQFWRKKTANHLANEFYENGDFISALKIYQAMAIVNKMPNWQWPVIYKIGLCFERLHMTPKAQEAYKIITDGTEWENIEFEMTPSLKSIQEMAQWRLEHHKWNIDTKSRIKNLLEVADNILLNPAETDASEETETIHN